MSIVKSTSGAEFAVSLLGVGYGAGTAVGTCGSAGAGDRTSHTGYTVGTIVKGARRAHNTSSLLRIWASSWATRRTTYCTFIRNGSGRAGYATIGVGIAEGASGAELTFGLRGVGRGASSAFGTLGGSWAGDRACRTGYTFRTIIESARRAFFAS